MKVLGSGFGRTGTLSLKRALERLGIGPCYHMREVLRRPAHIRAWQRAARGERPDLTRLLAGFESAVDFPTCLFLSELLELHPGALVVHTVREPSAWYESTRATIYRASSTFPAWLLAVVPPIRGFVDMQQRLIWEGVFEGRFEDRRRAIEIFEAHTQRTKELVPPERLLLFDPSDGWEPLCAFLREPVPGGPFPHAGDRRSMVRGFRATRLALRWGPPALAALSAAVLIGTCSG